MDIKNIYAQLGNHLNERERAEEALKVKEQAYEDFLEELALSNPAFKTLLEEKRVAESHLKNMTSLVRESRNKAQEVLAGEEKLSYLPVGFEQTRDRVYSFDPIAMREACLKNAPFLLTVDEKALDALITKTALDETTQFALPSWLSWMPIELKLTYKARISDTKVKTFAERITEAREAIANDERVTDEMPTIIMPDESDDETPLIGTKEASGLVRFTEDEQQTLLDTFRAVTGFNANTGMLHDHLKKMAAEADSGKDVENQDGEWLDVEPEFDF